MTNKNNSKFSVSKGLERYLRTIFSLSLQKKVIRVRDLSKAMKVKPSSVVGALRRLKAKGLIRYEKHEFIELTKEGKELAQFLQRRHKILSRFFSELLNLPLESAEHNVSLMEYYVQGEALERIVKFLEFLQTCPFGVPFCIQEFRQYLKSGRRPDRPLCHSGRNLNSN